MVRKPVKTFEKYFENANSVLKGLLSREPHMGVSIFEKEFEIGAW
jgi:hypothetical protein